MEKTRLVQSVALPDVRLSEIEWRQYIMRILKPNPKEIHFKPHKHKSHE